MHDPLHPPSEFYDIHFLSFLPFVHRVPVTDYLTISHLEYKTIFILRVNLTKMSYNLTVCCSLFFALCLLGISDFFPLYPPFPSLTVSARLFIICRSSRGLQPLTTQVIVNQWKEDRSGAFFQPPSHTAGWGWVQKLQIVQSSSNWLCGYRSKLGDSAWQIRENQ